MRRTISTLGILALATACQRTPSDASVRTAGAAVPAASPDEIAEVAPTPEPSAPIADADAELASVDATTGAAIEPPPDEPIVEAPAEPANAPDPAAAIPPQFQLTDAISEMGGEQDNRISEMQGERGNDISELDTPQRGNRIGEMDLPARD